MRLAPRFGLSVLLVVHPVLAQLGCPPPSGRMVGVAPDVKLHVMEWGGHGETVLFLSGLGTSAYAFDDFARLFVDRYRVIGVTRRGIPPSDSSTKGYAASLLTADIVAVMDSLKIDRAHVVGWSFGGDEAVMLAVNYPNRVRSVVLLDSYDNSPEAGTFTETDKLKTPDAPWVAADSSSAVALMWRARRFGSKPLPLTFFCALWRFDADGRLMGRSYPGARLNAIRAGMPKLPYSSLRQPLLAFFHVSRAIQDDYPEYPLMDSVDKALANAAFRPESLTFAAARNRLRSEAPRATIVELLGAPHQVFAQNPEIIFPEMIAFFRRARSASQ